MILIEPILLIKDRSKPYKRHEKNLSAHIFVVFGKAIFLMDTQKSIIKRIQVIRARKIRKNFVKER